ncbi:hypothetical protein Thimo_1379 [Thioflavicoccus mobilis 8321]|uniref:Uncharacterized protein n=1 Tax=Thioflavicoccus mobilis 8321 TaxID=765912 RepID=L0GTU0_9GAMM|nr:hypothetical protein [Thioflavicoccus mobilis]AGA90173.1 hypothetical protein Thimo_1379 [Thioflavicoccus mobilis 8321]
MKISAKDIERWAETREAQGELPRLIRRLAVQAGTVTEIAFPAGESVSRPGWDGQILSNEGDPWVPPGRSAWEVSVERTVTTKANRDYRDRTQATDRETRQQSTYVAVTARKWTTKDKWLSKKRAQGDWKDVRAYDSDDLEAWLEASPAIALAVAEEIGLAGFGVESLGRHWESWAAQCEPAISPSAFFADRQEAKDRLLTGLRKRIAGGPNGAYAIRADSAAEAAAFVCAALLEAEDLCSLAAVVTNEVGWQFVERNPRLRVAVAVRPEIAQRPAANVLTIVPIAAGDLASGYGGRDGEKFQLELSRPSIYAFREALIEIGVEESDARRLALATGRSWSVYRRRRATNQAIRRPEWLRLPEADALATLCLLGAWHGEKAADRGIVEQLTGEPYETVERKLRKLSHVDDAPVISIGKAWRAKAPLELLDLFADRITAAELDRFFGIVEALLVEPDPVLELEADKRWMAGVYGKVREESGLLFRSVLDALVKLAVRGRDYEGLATLDVDARVERLVDRLLQDADATRWLSLASHLSPLAEAAPGTFLNAVEASLRRPDTPVLILFDESVSADSPLSGGAWYYADLLWALESLAWLPSWMPRVAKLLARMSHVELPDNWCNRPFNSLLGIFRSWMPQTAATLDQRIAVLDRLIAGEPEIAFQLLDSLLHQGHDMASPASTPDWREDDAGTASRPNGAEIQGTLIAAADRMIGMATGSADRIARLLDKFTRLDATRADQVMDSVAAFTGRDAGDFDRELIRNALREKLHWHLSYGKNHPQTSLRPEDVARWRQLYEALAPRDPVIRHRWLFQDGQVDLPEERLEDFEQEDQRREEWRLSALQEIHRDLGLEGVLRLADLSGDASIVGRCLLHVVPERAALADWIADLETDFGWGTSRASLVRGILGFLPEAETAAFLHRVIQLGRAQGWPAERFAACLRLARDERLTWSLAEQCGKEAESAYWRIVTPWLWRADAADRDFAATKLLEAARPISALNTLIHHLGDADPSLLLEALESALVHGETDAKFPESWRLEKLVERLEAWDAMDQEHLLQIEFRLVPAFRLEATSALKALTKAITTKPELFTELVCLIWRPESSESRSDSPPSEGERIAAENAWRLLHDCRRQPGSLGNGDIDPDACVRFVDEALALCRAKDRAIMGEQTLGQILAHSPIGEDKIWPGPPARDILDRPELSEMRKGFEIGTFNKRGVTVRSMCEGGKQERELAAQFRRYANGVGATHPHLAESLERIARNYEFHATREDDDAALNRERY